MTQLVMLHPQDQKDLRIITQRGSAYGDDVQFCLTVPHEFRDVQACYPIVFRRIDVQPGWEALALFGLQPGENLFLEQDGNGWDAPYIPLMMLRQPFAIGAKGDRPQILIDLDHPRVSRTEGQVVFLRFGGTSEYMEQVNGILSALYAGLQDQVSFFHELSALGLLVPFSAEFEPGDGTIHSLTGFHAIDEDRLATLPADVLERLNLAGHLGAIYMAIASMSNLRTLVTRKERRHAART